MGFSDLPLRWVGALLACCLLSTAAAAPTEPVPPRTAPNLEGKTDRALRYSAQNRDFVITNGAEFFNRPLYGSNTAFRVDGGDKPEFSVYLPGRGGNLRFGLRSSLGTVWLHDARHIVTRYRPGELLYTLEDPALGPGARLELEALAYGRTNGLIVRVRGERLLAGTDLLVAYGGGNGQRGARDGDIGTERVPISEYFQFKPEFAKEDRFHLNAQGFVVDGKVAQLALVTSATPSITLSDASRWARVADLLASGPGEGEKVALLRIPLSRDAVHVSLQVTRSDADVELKEYLDVREPAADKPASVSPYQLAAAYAPQELATQFEATRAHFAAIRDRVRVETPDPYLDAAVAALNIADDATWDEPQGAVMHGAVAWRAKLLGWRGPYSLDALGSHDRARRNIDQWIARQNVSPVREGVPPPAENTHLARNPAGLHVNGDIMGSHYDMNVGFIDVVFRHLLWTGDVEHARTLWPAIERHLAWQRRLFRREFGPERLPLYEAYASIWASDNMQYHGGGVAYQSAYNIFHNRMAARIARLIGQDPTPYEQEAERLDRAMRRLLWMPERGAFAEFKDLLGDQLIHPSYGVWTFYHTLDSGVPTRQEAARMAQDVYRHLKRIPIAGPGVPADRAYHVLPSSRWMPYLWSLNNVVLAENLHTALALWQAGDNTRAYELTMGSVLASLYMGISPGNIGAMNYLDVYRRESMRDFADGVGVMSRAIVEGLFGVRPDALAGVLTLAPGFPRDWTRARLTHPSVGLSFAREGAVDTWTLGQSSHRFHRFVLEIPAPRERLVSATVDGRPVPWTAVPALGGGKLRVEAPWRERAVVRLTWSGAPIDAAKATVTPGFHPSHVNRQQGEFMGFEPRPGTETAQPACSLEAPAWTARAVARLEPVDLAPYLNDRVSRIFQRGKYRAPRSPFVSLAMPSQGIGAWAGDVNAFVQVDDEHFRKEGGVGLPGGVFFKTPRNEDPNVLFTSRWDNYPQAATVPLQGRATRAYLLMAGSTNAMQTDVVNGEVVIRYTDGTREVLQLRNPETWWPVDRDYFIDDYQFRLCGKAPVRVDLKTGRVTVPGPQSKGRRDRERIDGGAANVLDVALDSSRELASLELRTVANEVVIGLMAISLERLP